MAQSHPRYIDMVVKAIKAENKAKGSSRRAIANYVIKNFSVSKNIKSVTVQVNKAIVEGIEQEVLVHNTASTQDSGLFRVNTEPLKKLEATGVSSSKKLTVPAEETTIPEMRPESLKFKEDRNCEDEQKLIFHIYLPFSQLVFLIFSFLAISFLIFYFVFPLTLVRSYQ
ncbi:Histone H1-delta [Aphelenchoides besseyi]|nr:Histone H1-delta [Aphelenchoides besseyi]KAI6208104.1 Histone H1-delta [Aphelenchoides besseyi]